MSLATGVVTGKGTLVSAASVSRNSFHGESCDQFSYFHFRAAKNMGVLLFFTYSTSVGLVACFLLNQGHDLPGSFAVALAGYCLDEKRGHSSRTVQV